MIDNSYPCTIPLTSLRNGTESSIFTISQQKITLENKANIVYVNSNCVTYPVSFARDSSNKIYTNLVKYNDNNPANITLVSKITDVENFDEYIQKHNIRIAYITVGQGSACTSEQLTDFFADDLKCQQISSWPGSTLCDTYTSSSDVSNIFWPHINDYAIVFAEDPGNVLNDNSYRTINRWVDKGGVLLWSRNLDPDAKIAGITWKSQGGANCPLTATSYYYNNPDPYLILGGDISSPAQWTPKKCYYIENNPATTTQYNNIAEYSDGKDGTATWHNGSGFAYYFSSTCETGFNYGDFTQKIREALEKIIGTTKSNYLQTNITISPLPEKITSLKTTFKHNITKADSELVLLYFDGTKWINYVNLTPSTTETTETKDIPLLVPVSSNVGFTLLATAYQISKDEKLSVDLQNIDVCFDQQ